MAYRQKGDIEAPVTFRPLPVVNPGGITNTMLSIK